MLVRTLITFVSLATIAVAISVWYAFPHYAGLASYVLLGWMFGSLVLLYGPWSNRQVGRTRASGPPARPLPSDARASTPRVADLGFCVFCASPLAPGAPVCSSCGHAAARF